MALKLRRGTNSGRTAITPAEGEPIYTTDTKELYVGDGTTAGGIKITGGLADGDKGDITVSGSGATWTVDNDAVTYAKIQNVSAASKLLGRGDSGSGDVQEITLGTGLTMTGTTLAASGGGSAPQVQVDTITSSQTWTPPAWGKYFKVYLYGGGSGGGSGARQATTTARSGGGGGAGASVVIMEYTNSQITGAVSVTIGSGGSGGASVTTDSTSGNSGSVGGISSFGSLISTYSQSGQGGSGGTTSSGTNGQGISTISLYSYGNIYTDARSGRTTTGDSRIFTNENTFALGGGCGGAGGGGAGASSTTTANGGTFDLWSAWLPISASSGGTNGGNGNDGVSFIYGYLTLGTPGGGGSYKTGQATGRGGDGSYGCGGGGGAASDNGFASGRGGNGGGGICIIVTIG
jgi:hypothetical protein